MRQYLLITILFGWGLLVACGTPPPPPDTATPMAVSGGLNLLVETTGNVQLQRDGWRDFNSAGFGTVLHTNDFLKIEGQAAVLCGNLQLYTLTGSDGQPCPVAPGRLIIDGYAVIVKTQGNTPIPYVQQPRNSYLLKARPLLRWHDTGALTYTVSVRQRSYVIWEEIVNGTEMTYPDDAPALRPDEDYRLVVEADGVSSDEEDAIGVGFQRLNETDRQQIEAYEQQLGQLANLSPSAVDFARATYYATWRSGDNPRRGLFSEAIWLLESLAPTQEAPAIHLWRGDILQQTGLPNEAEIAYETAQQQAISRNDLETQAAAEFELAQLTGEKEFCETALTLYGRLGDTAQVEQLCATCNLQASLCKE